MKNLADQKIQFSPNESFPIKDKIYKEGSVFYNQTKQIDNKSLLDAHKDFILIAPGMDKGPIKYNLFGPSDYQTFLPGKSNASGTGRNISNLFANARTKTFLYFYSVKVCRTPIKVPGRYIK